MWKKIIFFHSIHFKKSLHGSHRKTWHYAFFPFCNANINERNNTSLKPPSAYVSTTQLSDSAVRSSRTGKDDVYLPAITKRASSLNSIKGALSQSCPYLHEKRRGSFSSVASQRAGGHSKKQVICHMSYLSWKEKKSIDSSYPCKTTLVPSILLSIYLELLDHPEGGKEIQRGCDYDLPGTRQSEVKVRIGPGWTEGDAASQWRREHLCLQRSSDSWRYVEGNVVCGNYVLSAAWMNICCSSRAEWNL